MISPSLRSKHFLGQVHRGYEEFKELFGKEFFSPPKFPEEKLPICYSYQQDWPYLPSHQGKVFLVVNDPGEYAGPYWLGRMVGRRLHATFCDDLFQTQSTHSVDQRILKITQTIEHLVGQIFVAKHAPDAYDRIVYRDFWSTDVWPCTYQFWSERKYFNKPLKREEHSLAEKTVLSRN